MSDSALKAVDFEKYFLLMRETLPGIADISVCTPSGIIIAAHRITDTLKAGDRLSIDEIAARDSREPASSLKITRCSGRLHCLMRIFSQPGELSGFLVGSFDNIREALPEGVNNLVEQTFNSVIACIEKEYRLTAELDAMAIELANRYEELNLVYETNNEMARIEQEDEAIKKLIDNYVQYLEVDMVALIFPGDKKAIYTNNKTEPVHDPDEVIRQFYTGYLPVAQSDGTSILINQLQSDKRDALGLTAPYKIIACPVWNGQDTVFGAMICLSHMHRPDYLNSDRNLLEVMAKNVSKIIQQNYNPLTGLMNLHAFETRLRKLLASPGRSDEYHCLLNIDLDQLKIVNDTFGRDAGDHLIRNIARLLQGKLRNTDTICYLGEARFCVLLEQCSIVQGLQVSEHLRKSVEETDFSWKSSVTSQTVTIGLALIDNEIQQADEALEAAEIARDTAKELGPNRIHVYRDDDVVMTTRKDQMRWVSRIQTALREDDFSVYCQTIQPVAGCSEAYHFEILLRMNDTNGTCISPNRFLPAAERFNIMPVIDRWVIDTTFQHLASAGFALSPGEGVVAINLSGQSLTDSDLSDYISDRIAHYGISPDCICFEITETAAIKNIESACTMIAKVRSMGCHFSLDDFGTGLSSFSYLKQLPVDYLKIDGSFVRAILDDAVSHAIVASINQIGHVMKIKTIAEYVENDSIGSHLELMGIDYLQGYAIAVPVPLGDYLTQLRNPFAALTG